MRQAPIKIGDIFEIPLTDYKKAYGQYMVMDKYGPIIKIFNYINKVENNDNIEDITETGQLFPPIYTGLYAAIRTKLWKIIGHKEIKNFEFPGFITTLTHPETNEATIWFLWNGRETVRLGKKVQKEYQGLEFLAVYSPNDIPKRIETGKKPFEELILTNKLPRPN